MISVESIESRASRLIERVLSSGDPDDFHLLFLEWAKAFELLLSDEAGAEGRAAALRLQQRIESVLAPAVGTGSTRQAASPGGGE